MLFITLPFTTLLMRDALGSARGGPKRLSLRTWGAKEPIKTPTTMAKMIHTGRRRSNQDRLDSTARAEADEVVDGGA